MQNTKTRERISKSFQVTNLTISEDVLAGTSISTSYLVTEQYIVGGENSGWCITDKKVIKKEKTSFNYKLQEASYEEILMARRKNNPLVILKHEGQYFFAFVDSKLSIGENKKHLCAMCHRLRALPTSEGGCDKVLAPNGKRIEKFSFITEGLQCSNSKANFFLVFECDHFDEIMEIKRDSYITSKKRFTEANESTTKVEVIDEMYDEVTDEVTDAIEEDIS